jgi:hypothetical protein
MPVARYNCIRILVVLSIFALLTNHCLPRHVDLLRWFASWRTVQVNSLCFCLFMYLIDRGVTYHVV